MSEVNQDELLCGESNATFLVIESHCREFDRQLDLFVDPEARHRLRTDAKIEPIDRGLGLDRSCPLRNIDRERQRHGASSRPSV